MAYHELCLCQILFQTSRDKFNINIIIYYTIFTIEYTVYLCHHSMLECKKLTTIELFQKINEREKFWQHPRGGGARK